MRILLTLLTVALLLPSAAVAGPSPAQKCAAAKMLAVGKATLAVVKCRRTALLKSEPIDPACITKAEGKLADAFAKAEAKGGCANVVDLPLIETYLDTCVSLYSELEALACGDGAGDGGEDIPCSCGSLVVTNTTLDDGFDPVVETTCGLSGLQVDAGVVLNLGGHTISGGAGVGITPDDGSSVLNGRIEGFAVGVAVADGAASLADLSIDGNGQGLVVGEPDCATSPVVELDGSDSTVSDNDGTGVLVHACSSLTITGTGGFPASNVQILNNGGIGIDVRGALTATWVAVGRSAGHGIKVESDQPVLLTDVDVHNSGKHPTLPPAESFGIYVLRTSVPATSIEDGFLIQSTESQGRSHVRYNAGHGIVLGDAAAQSGPVYGSVRDVQMYENDIGIRVEQKDPVTAPTHSNIAGNNIFNNDGSGISMKTSYQRPLPGEDRRVITSNDVHHNAVVGDGCSTLDDVQTASQIVFDGKVMGSDPASPPNAGSFPDDYACYQNGGVPVPEFNCDRMNDPEDVLSGGVNNHCIWTGTECRLAWDMSGTVGTGECGTSDNRIFAYINHPVEAEITQKGVVATNGAYVLARRNTWGVGGADNGTHAASGTNSEIDFEEACATISTCTDVSPPSP
jgi:hypothetical protein